MYSQLALGYSAWREEWPMRLASLLMLLTLAVQPLITIFPPQPVWQAAPWVHPLPAAHPARRPVPAPVRPRAAGTARPYPLPPALVGKTEMPGLRTLDSVTFDMGDGTFAVLQDAEPLHYRDEDGAWQRIDPTFVAESKGWTNYTNALHTALSTAHSAARITAEGLGVVWEPQTLQATAADGTSAPLATLRPPDLAQPGIPGDDGRSVRFPQSWSLAGLQDQWQAGAGRVEYTLQLPQLPAPKGGNPLGAGSLPPTTLDLRVQVRLLAGTQLYVGGQPATLPLTTRGPLAFVAANGNTVELMPPTTYEQAARTVATDAVYTLTPTGQADVIELAVQTPWAWLAAPARRFPVIIDPLFQVRAATQIATARYNPNQGCTFVDIQRGAATNWLGRTEGHCNRLLVRFGIPVLPTGATITKAWLLAAPTQASGPYGLAATNVSVYRVNNVNAHQWWVPLGPGDNEVEPAYDAAPLAPDPQWTGHVNSSQEHLIRKWDVTSAVNSWLYTASTGTETLFEKNGGLLLRASNEACPLGVVFDPTCGALGFANPGDNWAAGAAETAQSESADAPYFTSNQESGVRLVVFYNGPTLVEGTTLTLNPVGGGGMPPGDYPYYQVDSYAETSSDGMNHIYTLPATPNNRWQAVAVRGFGPTSTATVTGNNAVDYAVTTTPKTGALPLGLFTQGDKENVFIPWRTVATNNVSWLLRNGRGTPPTISEPRQLRVGGNSMDVPPAGYDIRLIKERETLQTTIPLSKTTVTRFYDTSKPMDVWNLNLPAGSNTEIKVEFGTFNSGDGDNIHTLDFKTLDDQFDMVLVNSDDQLDWGGSDRYKAGAIPGNTPGYTELVRQSSQGVQIPSYNAVYSADVQNVPGGQFALVLNYNGPTTRVDNYEPPPSVAAAADAIPQDVVPAAGQPTFVALAFKITILSCPNGSYPDANGNCRAVRCPANNVAAGNKRIVEDMMVWSEGGWTAGDPTATTLASGPAPLIGKADGSQPTVAILGDLIYNKNLNPATLFSSANSKAILLTCAANSVTPTASFVVAKGSWQRYALDNKSILGFAGLGSYTILRWPWLLTDRQDIVNSVTTVPFQVRPLEGTAGNQGELRRMLDQDDGPPVSLFFPVAWSWTAAGWSSLSATISAKAGNPAPPEIASLLLTLGNQVQLDVDSPRDTDRYFRALRAANSVIAQKAELGGASRPVQAVILPRGVPVPETNALCTASCIDLRGPADSFTHLDRRWEMPDVHTDVGAGTVMMSAPGNLTVYSTDHPTLVGGADFATSYSFDAYQAEVSITKEKCLPTDTKEVLVVRGGASMVIPGIGSGDGAAIGAEFKLCDTALRETHMFFSSSVGIPIGTTGLFLTGLDGHVTISPVGTEIKVGLDFQASQGGDGGLLRVRGEVTINTQGLFAFQGNGTVLGILDAEGKIWVAWNPLDVGLEISLALEDWLRGYAYAHMWVGQGFGNKYTWLPDNDERHLAAEWGVTLSIETGDITSFPPLPPFDIEIGFVAAFGQFCTNGGCTTYEWGVKGKFIVMGVDVGLYYGFDEGLDFILGNDNHILIDQYGGAFVTTLSASAAGAGAVSVPQVAPAAVNGVVHLPFTVSDQAEGMLVGLAWQAGAPTLTLIDPDGVEINAGNAAGFQAEVAHGTDNGLSFTWFGVKAPKPGNWQAKIANLSETGVEHYRFWYFANKGAPGAPGNQGAFTKPSQNDNANGVYEIAWSVPANTPDTATISLYSMRTQVITGNLESGVPIVQNLPFKTGKFAWNSATVRNGAYQIRAVVDDGVNDLPAGQVAIPLDPCVALTTGLPQPRAFDPNRFPGTVVFTSTATITVNDLAAPAPVTGLNVKPGDNALLASWTAGGEKDLSNYLVRWGPRNGGAFVVENQQLVPATKTPKLRIGAVDNGVEYGVDVFALDFNGNTSASSGPVFATPNGLANPEPSTPVSLTVTSVGSTSAGFSWSPGPGAVPASYRLTYVKLGVDAGMGQQDANGTSATINGLATGGAYAVFVAAANSDGWYSLPGGSPQGAVRVVITNGNDGNADGLADDWATAFGVAGGGNDPDGDGLTNAQEQAAGSNPTVQDSDADGYSDGEEVAGGFDAVSNASVGFGVLYPRVDLARDRLNFNAKRPAGTAPMQAVAWDNTGGGNAVLQASTQESWIKPAINGDQVEVSVDFPDAAAPGFYSGVVRLNRGAGSDPLIGDAACVRVNAWLLPADNEFPPVKEQQTITFDPVPNKLVGDAPFGLTAVASSGLPVSFTSTTPAVCAVTGSTVTLAATGVCTLFASQPGNDQYAAAPDVFRSFSVTTTPVTGVTYLPTIAR